jgi:hypothetical protein
LGKILHFCKAALKVRLNSLLESAIRAQNRINIEKGKDYTEVFGAIELAASYSQDILKTEWERVKLGEKSFQITKNTAMPLIIIISLGILIFYFKNAWVLVCR